jgi:DNA-binding NarL/FixJ family response regulator
MTTLLLCDDHQLFREGLAALLAQQRPDWRILAQTGDGEEAIRLAEALRPDIAILDLAMPGLSGIEVAGHIRQRSPDTHIVALSMYGDSLYRRQMLAAGANGYVLKNEAGSDLLMAIETVLRGERFLSPALTAELPEPTRGGRSPELDYATLTAREREVLSLLARGRRTREIAAELGISVKTVETYRGRIMLKLGIDNLTGLVLFAVRAGIVVAD